MNLRELKRALRAGERVYGTCVISTAPQWPTMIAGAGLDFVFIDTEHIAIDRMQLAWMCQAYTGHGLPPIVRIPSPDPYRACQMLDAGALGVVAPYVETVDEVRRLRGAVKFRPLKGEKLERLLQNDARPDGELGDYLEAYNRDRLCIVNIESEPAVQSIDEILAVPDIDALLIGPHDLSINLGIPEQYEHSRFQEAVHTIIDEARAAGVGVGVHYAFGIEDTIGWAKDGLNLIIHASDLFLARDKLIEDLHYIRESLGDAPRTTGPDDTGPGTVDV